jgi:endogenous inhibitor of DNA gyrase (YacG/DUF329 family)
MGRGGKRVSLKVEMLICQKCGKSFLRKGTGRPAKFCSKECKYIYERKKYQLEHPKELKSLRCKHCNKLFESYSRKTKYCSDQCKKLANDESRPVYEKKCVQCGIVFTTKKKNQKTCSQECGRKQGHETQKKYYTCRYCGKIFSKENAYRMKYCSTACAYAANRIPAAILEERAAKKKLQKLCLWCGKSFITTYSYKKYCSKQCSYCGSLRDKRNKWAEEFVPINFKCKECGTSVVTECGKPFSSFCSIECQEKYVNRGYKQRRKEQMRLAYKEPVYFKKIFRRDKGICGICGMPVPYDKDPFNIWAATIDHIIPLSQGGTHEATNCQLAHRICNSLKQDSTEGFIIDWETKNQQDEGRWTDYLDNYKKQIIS